MSDSLYLGPGDLQPVSITLAASRIAANPARDSAIRQRDCKPDTSVFIAGLDSPAMVLCNKPGDQQSLAKVPLVA